MGDKVIIAILPHENANKLMAKWKGPFTVTKIPNWFQIEHLDGNVTRLTHISYVKKYNERCHYTEQVGMARQKRVSKHQPWVRMARLRLIAGTGCRKARMVASSMKAIQENWGVQSGRIRVQVLGEVEDLPSGLQAIVEAAGPDSCIEGSVLVDLCTQRSGQRGSGCDAPNEAEELPMPMASSPRPSTLPAAPVRQYSWHYCAKNDVSDIRREFVGANKRTNRVSPFLSQQTPLVSRVHLLKVVRKTEKNERSKGKHLTDFMFKSSHLSRRKDMTSLLLPGQKSEGRSTQYSVMRECSSSEMSLFDHEYQHTNDKCTLKRSKAIKKEREAEFKHPGSTNYDDIECDVIVTEVNGDVTRQDVNKPIARKRYAQKHSFVSKMGFINSSLRVCSRTFTKAACMLAIVIGILGGLCNIKLPERKRPIGTSSSLSPYKPRVVLRFLDSSVLPYLRESAAATIGINEGLCSCIRKGMFLNNNKQLIRRMKVLQNTIICEETICTNRSLSGRLKLAAPYVYPDYATYALATFAKNVCAGKHLDLYIFPSADFCTYRVDYLDTYIVNLDSDDNFTVFYNLIYSYIYNVYCSWA